MGKLSETVYRPDADAADAYDKYLQLAPEGSHASAIRSIIDQLRQQAAEQEQQQTP